MDTLKIQKFNLKELIQEVLVIAIPVALQNLLTNAGSLVDTFMISSLGKSYVGALGLCSQFSTLMFSCYWGFVCCGMLFISQYWGAKDDKGIERSYGITIICLLTISLIFGSFCFFCPKFVISIFTDIPEFIEIGIDYLKIIGFSYPLQVLSIGMSSLLRSTEKVKIPLYASIASVATNSIFNWILIFGHLGFPAMGVKGAAIATVISAFVNALFIIIAAAFSKYPYLFKIKNFFAWDKEFIFLFFKKCMPIFFNEFLIGIGNFKINIVLGHQVAEAVNALAIFRTLEGMIIGFFAGFSNAASVLVGKCVGSGETKKAFQRAIRIVYFCQITIFAVVLILMIIKAPLLTLLNLDGDSFEYGKYLIIIYGIACIIRMGNWTQNDTYRSAGDATFGTVLEIVFMYSLVLPCVTISHYVFKAPFLLIFALCYIDEPIRYMLMQFHMYSGKWIKPITPEGKEGLKKLNEEFLNKTNSKKNRKK